MTRGIMNEDMKLLVQLRRDLRNDANPPVLDLAFDPYDRVAIELIFVRAEALVEDQFERYRAKYQPRLTQPALFDEFLAKQKIKIHDHISQMVEQARARAVKAGYKFEEFDSTEGGLVN